MFTVRKGMYTAEYTGQRHRGQKQIVSYMKCSVPEGVHATPVVNLIWAEPIISQRSQGQLMVRSSTYRETHCVLALIASVFFLLRLAVGAAGNCRNILKKQEHVQDAFSEKQKVTGINISLANNWDMSPYSEFGMTNLIKKKKHVCEKFEELQIT